jgi:hypothetical protein
LNALFGELANLYEHYSYVSAELPAPGAPESVLQQRFQMSRYGALRTLEDVTRFGFLAPNDVRLVMQLGLRVRNADELLNMLLSRLGSITAQDITSVRLRANYIVSTVTALMDRLMEGRPRLAKVAEAIRRDVPSSPWGQSSRR